MDGRGGKGMVEQKQQKTQVAQAAEIVVEQRAHAILSASGSPIWLTCTPAGRFQEEFEDTETDYSREGTWAHSVAAHRLNEFLGRETEFGKEKFIPGFEEFANVDSSEAISAYVRRCIIAIGKAREETPDAVVLMEQRLDFSDWVPEGFGTGDLVIISNRRCLVRDLKFGKGVRVDAEDNTQLYMYALGAIAAYRGIYDFDEVVVEIDQPRLNHVDGGDIVLKVSDLLGWAQQYVAPRAQLAWEGKGEFVAGDHCRWCRARNACAARAAHLKDAVDACFEDAEAQVEEKAAGKDVTPAYERLTDEQLIALYPKLDQLVKWANGLKEHVLDQAVKNGKKWPGYKLVTGRSNRVITNPEGLAEVLLMEGTDEALIYEPPRPRELVGLGELEKIVGKKNFAELSKGFVEKPAGKPTLVPESDKRDELVVQAAEEMFE
jgi:hypothetical protein